MIEVGSKLLMLYADSDLKTRELFTLKDLYDLEATPELIGQDLMDKHEVGK